MFGRIVNASSKLTASLKRYSQELKSKAAQFVDRFKIQPVHHHHTSRTNIRFNHYYFAKDKNQEQTKQEKQNQEQKDQSKQSWSFFSDPNYRPSLSEIVTAISLTYGVYEYYKKNSNEKQAASTQLGMAAIEKNHKKAENLLSGGNISVNEQDKFGKTPLHYAAKNGDTEVCELLLRYGSDITIKDKNYSTTFYESCTSNELSTVQLLHRASQEKDKNSSQKLEVFRQASVVLNGVDPLEEGMYAQEIDVVNCKNKIGITPLIASIWFENNKTTSYLISSANAQIDAQTLKATASYGNKETLNLILSKNKDLSVDEIKNAYHLALERLQINHCNSIQYESSLAVCNLLADELKKRKIEKTFLSEDELAFVNRLNIIEANQISSWNIFAKNSKLQYKCDFNFSSDDVNQRDNKGRTQLYCAARNKNINEMRRLLSEGADPNISNNYNDTPLHVAARYGNNEMVSLLLGKSKLILDPAGGDFQHTPLHIAARKGYYDVTKSLLDAGANRYQKSEHGRTAADLATNSSIKELLQEHRMANTPSKTNTLSTS